MSCKIAKLELENVKRVRAVEITPAQTGVDPDGSIWQTTKLEEDE